jgi:hypothetical protein
MNRANLTNNRVYKMYVYRMGVPVGMILGQIIIVSLNDSLYRADKSYIISCRKYNYQPFFYISHSEKTEVKLKPQTWHLPIFISSF